LVFYLFTFCNIFPGEAREKYQIRSAEYRKVTQLDRRREKQERAQGPVDAGRKPAAGTGPRSGDHEQEMILEKRRDI
jgi:hypothetical protein